MVAAELFRASSTTFEPQSLGHEVSNTGGEIETVFGAPAEDVELEQSGVSATTVPAPAPSAGCT